MGWHVAVLGTGSWSRVHLKALAASPHVDRVTLAGRNEQAAAELANAFPIVTATRTDFNSVFNDASIELVHVCLPHHLHADVSCAALAAGKHVICEKPAATSLADFDRIVQTATSANRRFLVVMNQLFNPLVHRAKEIIDTGQLGRPFLCVETGFSHHARFYRDPNAWRTRVKESGGGVLIDGGYHMVYKQLFLLASSGHPQWVVGDAAQLNVDESGQKVEDVGEDYVSYTVGYDGPLRVVSSHAWTLAADVERPRRGFIAGAEATLELPTNIDDTLVIRRSDSVEIIGNVPGPRNGPDTTHQCLLAYIDAIVKDRALEHTSIDAARETLAIILAVYESATQQQRTNL